MCRVLAYIGQPVLLDDLLYKPDNSLVRQCYDPKMMAMLNLAGFGMCAWDTGSHAPEVPFTYKTTSLPMFDQNLKQLSRKIRAHALLAHVRGVPYTEQPIVGLQNLHPFRFEGLRLAMAHNGDLWGFDTMRFELLKYIRPEIAARICGSTDSEWIYALLISQIPNSKDNLRAPDLIAAVEKTLLIIREVREHSGLSIHSPVNLFLCDGRNLVATRYIFDYGCYPDSPDSINVIYPSLWYTFGSEYGFHDGEWSMKGGVTNYDSVVIASEPLTGDVSTWLEVPEYSMLSISFVEGSPKVSTRSLDL
jgi:glutamine amidotransferase